MTLKIGIIDGENTSQYTGSFSGSFSGSFHGSGITPNLQEVTTAGSITDKNIQALQFSVNSTAKGGDAFIINETKSISLDTTLNILEFANDSRWDNIYYGDIFKTGPSPVAATQDHVFTGNVIVGGIGNFDSLLEIVGDITASGHLFASASQSTEPFGAGIQLAVYNTSSGEFMYTASSAVGGGIPGGVTKSIQFNEDGKFEGSEQFLITSSLREYSPGARIPVVLLASSSSPPTAVTTRNIIETQGSIDILQGELKVSGYNPKGFQSPFFAAIENHPVNGDSLSGEGRGGTLVGQGGKYGGTTTTNDEYSGTTIISKAAIFEPEDALTGYRDIFTFTTSSYLGAVVDYSFVAPLPGYPDGSSINFNVRNKQYGWTGTSQCIWPQDANCNKLTSQQFSQNLSNINFTDNTTTNLFGNDPRLRKEMLAGGFIDAGIRWVLKDVTVGGKGAITKVHFQFKPNSLQRFPQFNTGLPDKPSFLYFNATCKFLGGAAPNMSGFNLDYDQ